MQIRAEIDQRAIDDIKRLLKPGDAKKALQRAVSVTIDPFGVRLVADQIGKEVNLNKARIKASISRKLGSRDNPTGSISIDKGKGVWLSEFLKAAARRLKSKAVKGQAGMFKRIRPKGGVKVSVRKRGTAKYPVTETLPKAFLESMTRGPIGIFERIGIKRVMKSGRYKGKVREVIKRKRGPSPLGIFINAQGEQGARTIFEDVFKRLVAKLEENMNSQLQRFLNPRANDRGARS